jgi:hypothetical protein
MFCNARSRFLDRRPGSAEGTAKIYVKIVPEALGDVLVAQLDTGAAWSVLDADVAAEMSLLDGSGFPAKLSRDHVYDGYLHRIWIDLPADAGQGYGFEATVWVCADWRQGNFLGYEGFLNRIRFAVDASDNSFYFGPM